MDVISCGARSKLSEVVYKRGPKLDLGLCRLQYDALLAFNMSALRSLLVVILGSALLGPGQLVHANNGTSKDVFIEGVVSQFTVPEMGQHTPISQNNARRQS